MITTSNTTISQSDLRLLRVFATIVETGGFTPAHIALNVAQSTVSSQMTALEDRLGMRLCDRGRSGFRVTEDGRAVYEAAQRLFRSIESFGSEVQTLRGQLSGEIHIGIVDNVITNTGFPLSRAIAAFEERQGDVRINLHVATPAEIERAVFEGRFHLGIGGYTRQISGMDYVPLIKEAQRLYCGRQHLLFDVDRAGIDLHQISECKFIKRPYVPDRHIPDIARLTPAAYAENMEVIAFLILSGSYIGYLPEHFAERWIEAGEMKALMPEQMYYVSTVELLSRKAEPYPVAVRYFREDLIRIFGESPDAAHKQTACSTSLPYPEPPASHPSD